MDTSSDTHPVNPNAAPPNSVHPNAGASSISENINEAADRVAQPSHRAADVATETLQAAAEDGEAGLQRAAQAAADTAQRTADKAADWRREGAAMASGARQRQHDLLAAVGGFARDKPLESIAIALAAGVVIGRLINRPQHHR